MIKVGYSKKNINPPIGMPIAGSYFHKESRGVLDDLYTRAIAFDDGECGAVIIAVDVCYLSDSFLDEVRERVSKENGISKEAVIVTCSHTHAGPEVNGKTTKEDPFGYITELKGALCLAAKEAFCEMYPAKLSTAHGKAEGVAFMRRYMMKDGSVVTNPQLGDPNIDHPIGEQNESLNLLKIEREDAKDIYVVNFGTHACMVGGYYTSADFPGVLTEVLERAIDGIHCVFITAPQGNSNHININPSPEELWLRDEDLRTDSKNRLRAHRLGEALAGEVLKIHRLAKEISSDKILFSTREILVPTNKNNDEYDEAMRIKQLHDAGRSKELPYKDMALTTVIARALRIVNMRDEPDYYSFFISAILIGDFIFVGLPGEPFVEIGNRVLSASPFKETMVAALTNGITYFPTSEDLRLGGYEAVSSKIGIGSDDVIVNGVKEIYKALAEKKERLK